MKKRFAARFFLALSCLLTACAQEEEGAGLVPTGVIPAITPSKDVDGAIAPDPGTTPGSGDAPLVASFAVVPARTSLSVPASGDESPLFETTKAFVLDPPDASAAIRWFSSDTQVAQVDAQGRVTALRPGTAVITASREGREATASVTVEAKGRLALRPVDLPPGASVLARLYDAEGTLLATSESGSFDRPSAGGLVAEVDARLAGRLVAVGRVEGMTLYANQVTTCEVPLNVPSLSTMEVSGGPGASVVLKGSRLGGWVKQSDGRLVPWVPSVSATVGDRPAAATLLGDGGSVRLTVPATFDGAAPYRALRLTIGGIPLDATYRLLGTLRIDSPDATVPVMGHTHFVASAKDTSGATVSSPGLAWEVIPEGQDLGVGGKLVGGIDEAGEFTAWRTGKGVIIARSGTLEATVSITVTE